MKRTAKSLLAVVIGNFLYALTVKLFLLPGNLVTGGTTGIALTINHFLPIPISGFVLAFNIVMLVVGFLFVYDFPLKKPGLKTIILLSAILAMTVGVIFAYTKFRVPAPTEESNPIVEEISPIVEEFVDDIVEEFSEEEHAQPEAE